MASKFFDSITTSRWEGFRISLSIRWILLKIKLCGVDLFIHHTEEGEEFMVAKKPKLAKLLFPRANIKSNV